tara:strand:+ start:101 stop:319 length:219 start_codon:yes stop_codon:yes gene_type:complete
MKLLVTEVEFDFDDGFIPLTKYEEDNILEQAIGIWDVDNEDELVDKISDTLGWCIKSIDYTSNLIHPLTSYL